MEAEDSKPMKIKAISLIFSCKLGMNWVDVGLEMWMKHSRLHSKSLCLTGRATLLLCTVTTKLISAPFRCEQWHVPDVFLLWIVHFCPVPHLEISFYNMCQYKVKNSWQKSRKLQGRCFGGKSVGFKVNFCPIFCSGQQQTKTAWWH